MEETNIQQVQTEQPRKTHKTWIIISVILAIIILLFIARIMIANSANNRASDMLQTFLFRQIGNSISGQSAINITNLDEAKSKLDSDESFVNNQLNELKSNGKILVATPNRTITCGDGAIISPEQSYNGAHCNYSVTSQTSSGTGFIYVNSNGTKAILEIWRYSSLLTLEKYSSYVLQINDEEPKTISSIFAQTLDEILYLAELVVDQNAFINALRTNPIINITDANIALSKLESINNQMEMPTAEQINSLDLKSGCLGSYGELNSNKELVKTSLIEKIFFVGPSQSKMCENLEAYHKKNALKILEEAQATKNPFIAIGNKLHLNLLVKCSSEIFPAKNSTHACRNDYVKEFNEKFSSA